MAAFKTYKGIEGRQLGRALVRNVYRMTIGGFAVVG